MHSRKKEEMINEQTDWGKKKTSAKQENEREKENSKYFFMLSPTKIMYTFCVSSFVRIFYTGESYVRT